MSKGEEIQSGIWLLKSKFFIYRMVSYFSFLLIPIWLQKSHHMNPAFQGPVMIFYIIFMIGQWYLLGKEIDYRFKIYFKVNSSADRLVYRLCLGMFFIVFYFNLLSFLPSKWLYNSFWITWVVLGLFYSWPTRGKIIRESVSSSFNEIYYLDGFEKTLLVLIGLFFFVSVPELPALTGFESLKLYLDPSEKYNAQIWNFLTVNYYPFRHYEHLFKLSLFMHYYFINVGIFLLILYSLLRYFVSRRLGLLGVFAFLSSWSFAKIIGSGPGISMVTVYAGLWLWVFLWVTKSATYRSGLIVGLVGYWGTLINDIFYPLAFIQILTLYFLFLKDKNRWYRNQMVKYALAGVFLLLMALVFGQRGPDAFDSWKLIEGDRGLWSNITGLIERKAFYALALVGIILWPLKLKFPNLGLLKNIYLDHQKQFQLTIAWLFLLVYAFVFDFSLMGPLSLFVPIVLLSVITLEVLFQLINRMRSSRNMIYLIYIIICLLDSHVEGRLKIFFKFFDL